MGAARHARAPVDDTSPLSFPDRFPGPTGPVPTRRGRRRDPLADRFVRRGRSRRPTLGRCAHADCSRPSSLSERPSRS
ncbi:hypothetical protein GS506_24075 [Rhodococcus hoagii]|nr:hypothetical protein [Prescottella equi]